MATRFCTLREPLPHDFPMPIFKDEYSKFATDSRHWQWPPSTISLLTLLLVGDQIVDNVHLDCSVVTILLTFRTHKISHINHLDHMAQLSSTHAHTSQINDHNQINISNYFILGSTLAFHHFTRTMTGAAEGLEKWCGKRGQLKLRCAGLSQSAVRGSYIYSKNWQYTKAHIVHSS